jgi:hypothetical protein
MKAVFASFSSLIAVTVLMLAGQSAHGAALSATRTLAAFKSCDAALTQRGKHKTLTINGAYAVALYKLTGLSSKTTHIVVWIEDRPVKGEETPTITAVCVDKTQVTSDKPGDIDFQSSSNDKIYIRFHLEGLTRSKWKKDTSSGFVLANDSVMMQKFKYGDPIPKPDLTQWPDCAKPKHVDVSDDPVTNKPDTEISFNFSRCANATKNIEYYEYKLVLDKYPVDGGGGAPTDFPIDPLIINKP